MSDDSGRGPVRELDLIASWMRLGGSLGIGPVSLL